MAGKSPMSWQLPWRQDEFSSHLFVSQSEPSIRQTRTTPSSSEHLDSPGLQKTSGGSSEQQEKIVTHKKRRRVCVVGVVVIERPPFEVSDLAWANRAFAVVFSRTFMRCRSRYFLWKYDQ
jgi:hypothetical protein